MTIDHCGALVSLSSTMLIHNFSKFVTDISIIIIMLWLLLTQVINFCLIKVLKFYHVDCNAELDHCAACRIVEEQEDA